MTNCVHAALRGLRKLGIKPSLTDKNYRAIADAFNRPSLPAVFVLAQLALENQPITVRGLLYRAQAAGLFPSTARPYYRQTGRIVLKLRRTGLIPYSWIVDSTRRRLKPSSWSGLTDFAESAAAAYRLNFWGEQNDYIEIFCEKDAMAGIVEPVTSEFDVYLNVIRGHVSETFAWNVAEQWKQIEKPIYAYYLGDHDPAGLKIEASLRERLQSFTGKKIEWERLAINDVDFADRNLLGMAVKRSGNWREYLAQYGDRCVEVDALPPGEIRARVRRAIENHIDDIEWDALKQTEELERETLREVLSTLGNGADGEFLG